MSSLVPASSVGLRIDTTRRAESHQSESSDVFGNKGESECSKVTIEREYVVDVTASSEDTTSVVDERDLVVGVLGELITGRIERGFVHG